MTLPSLIIFAAAALSGASLPVLAGQATREQSAQSPDPAATLESQAQPEAVAAAAAAAVAAERAAVRAEAERNCPKPAFPQESLRAGHQGTVIVEYMIGDDGTVAGARVFKSSGFALLDAAGVNAISACRFKRAVKNGKPVPGWLQTTYNFLY